MKLYHWTLLYTVLFIAAACSVYIRIIELKTVSENKTALEDMLADSLDRCAERLIVCTGRDEPDIGALEDIRQTFAAEAEIYALREGLEGASEMLEARTVMLAVLWDGRMYVYSGAGGEADAADCYGGGNGSLEGWTVYDISEAYGMNETDRAEAVAATVLNAYVQKRGIGADIGLCLPDSDELMYLNGIGDRSVMAFFCGGTYSGSGEYVNIISSGARIDIRKYIYTDAGNIYHSEMSCGSAKGRYTARFNSLREAAAAGCEPCPMCVLQGIE